ncbi:hypothetical protein Gohar_010805 [Gossypium harknessii]|uniref:Uncharacterized protein n=1 Tax=Gossypium harknessii TaxID=34285 RepID=A0A7J9GS61_9ROSI|nr:hypothetical protein [Gossypium harknessii]
MGIHPQQSFLSPFPQPHNQPPRPPYLFYLQHSRPLETRLFHGYSSNELYTLND